MIPQTMKELEQAVIWLNCRRKEIVGLVDDSIFHEYENAYRALKEYRALRKYADRNLGKKVDIYMVLAKIDMKEDKA